MMFKGTQWLLIILNFTTVSSLVCYSCSNTDSKSSCNNNITCNAGQSCYKDVSSRATYYGCVDNSHCSLMSTSGSIVGRSLTDRRREATCYECCSTDGCNAALCSHPDSTDCTDDESVDCSKLNSLFGVCNDRHHAKTVCAKFCGLCNMVDGNWAEWSSWSSCDVTCGSGVISRTRTCTNPAPRDGGYDCKGDGRMTLPCVKPGCPVNGGWSGWASWEQCSVTCGVGLSRRYRSCSNPYPDGNGKHCFGNVIDVQICRPGACANGGWTTWSSWTKCSATCGGGFEMRSRSCTNPPPSPLGQYCDGDATAIQSCNSDPCSGSSGQSISFQSKDSVNETVTANNTIVFGNTTLNEGNGYDSSTGIFTAPQAGTYFFTTQMCLLRQNYLHWAIMANDVELKKGFFGDGSYNKCYTGDAVASLKKGDQVYMKCTTGSAKVIQDNDKWNTFTGVLLH